MSRTITSFSPFASLRRLGSAILFLVLATTLQAQDAIRPSMAGEASAEARRLSIDRIPYNLLAGPIRFRFSATLGFEYNDNVNYSDLRPEEDFIIRPQLNLNALWPVTQLNTLRLDLGIGYAFHLENSEYNTTALLLTPSSALAFDIFVGDFRINFHDRFSLQQDPLGEPGLSNTADYGRFENTIGVSVLWDLNKVVLTLGYDHYNFIATNDTFDYLNRNSEILLGSASFAITSTTSVGIEGSYIFSRVDDDFFLSDSDTYTFGGFVETQITSNLSLRVAGGYQNMMFERGTVVFGPFPPGVIIGQSGFIVFRDSQELDDYYVNLLATHRLNAAFSHHLAIGHEAQLGVNSNYIQLNYIRHTATWNVINRTLLATEFFYEDGDESGGFIGGEHLQRIGGALSVGYQLTSHVTLGARYQYVRKDSNALFRDYRQNRVSIDGTYSF